MSLRKARLAGGGRQSAFHAWAVIACHTVDIYLLLVHELPQALQAGGGVDLLHVDWSFQ